MKILHSINSLASGGAEVFVASLAAAQSRDGHQVSVFTYSGALDEKGRALERSLELARVMHHTPRIRRNTAKLAVPIALARTIAWLQPDIVHSHLEQSDVFVWLAARLTRTPFKWARTVHNSQVPSFPSWVLGRVARSCDISIACSNAVWREYPYLGRSSRVIENGIDVESLVPRRPRQAVRDELGVAQETPLLINVGALELRSGLLQKGQDIALRALATMIDLPWAMVFLGDGAQRNHLERLAGDLGLGGRCIFQGRVAAAVDYLNAADVVVMASRSEGLSIACIEAACIGKPLVVSKLRAFEEFTRPSTRFVTPESPEDLAAGIRFVLDHLNTYEETARHEVSSYRRKFDIRAVARRYLTCYEDILSAPQ